MAYGDPQNIYDDPEFFASYSSLDRSVHGLDAAPEWETIKGLLPPLTGSRVTDLGCGFGWFCRWAVEHGAASAVGYDLSENMLARAEADTDDTRITYHRVDLDRLELECSSADLVYSSLALHYLFDLDRLFAQVRAALGQGDWFVFSAEHPIYTGPVRPGWHTMEDGSTVWLMSDYLREGPRTTSWLTDGVVKQHRTIATYINALVRADFAVTRLEEWSPSPAQIAANPRWDIEVHRPNQLLVSAQAV